MTNEPNLDDLSKAELIERVEALEAELENASSGYTRRSVIAGAAGIAAAGAMGVYATGTASAAPSGTFPAETDDPLKKTRVDRVRYIGRSTSPSAPSSGRVISYVDESDLP